MNDLPNPYQSPREHGLVSRTHAPRGACLLITLLATLVWCFVVLWSWTDSDNPAGAILYSVILSTLALPVALANAYLFGPLLDWIGRRMNQLPPVIMHVLVFLATVAVWTVWLTLLRSGSLPAWTMIPWYLGLFLLPPMLCGSLVYGLRSAQLRPRP